MMRRCMETGTKKFGMCSYEHGKGYVVIAIIITVLCQNDPKYSVHLDAIPLILLSIQSHSLLWVINLLVLLCGIKC